MKNSIVKLDVRDDLRKGIEPFSKIMGAVSALRPDEQLLLIAPFEPVPLFSVLKRQGFEHVSRELESGDFEVLFTRDPNARVAAEIPKTPPLNTGKVIKNASAKSARARGDSGKTEIVDVDARGLEPPQPLMKILEALADLPENAELRAKTDRRPVHLYGQLEDRGFSGASEEQSDGSFITSIRRH
ncbi:MAG TPA: DUF2249 domain-containing protein [Verrucomicrobiae bacterium]|nr:DUF2249 domain-containing protein [Verrucomicrobiae bacterium]